ETGPTPPKQPTLTARWTTTAKTALTSRYDHRLEIAGRLTGPGGTPIAGALIDFTATPAYAGAKPITMTSPRTDQNGRFSVSLTGLSSHSLLLASRSPPDDTLPAPPHPPTLSVPAAITLRI